MQCHTVFCGHSTVHYVGRTRKPHGKHQNHESATILKKMTSIYCLTLNIWRPSWILPTMQCLKVPSGRTTMSGVPENPMVDTKNHESATILKKMISIYCSTLNVWRPSWSLPTMQCLKVRFGHPTMQAYHKTPW